MNNAFQLPMIREKRVDGLILSNPALNASFILKLYKSGLPVVLFDNALQKTDLDCVLHENEESVYQLTQHLIHEHQHQTIVFLSGPDTWLSSQERAAGYRRALVEASSDFIASATSTERSSTSIPPAGSGSASAPTRTWPA